MKFTDDELMFLIQAASNATIYGKDALLVANIIATLQLSLEKKADEPKKAKS